MGDYGTPEHEAWLLELERTDVPDERPDQPYTPCGCTARAYGGDCAHTTSPELEEELAQALEADAQAAGDREAPGQVLEVLYVAAGSNRTRAEYFPAGELGEPEYVSWLNWPSRVNDPDFYVWTVSTVLVGRAYYPAQAVRAYERGRRLVRPAGR